MKLTQAEEQVMMLLWELDAAFVNDIIDQMPEPKPAYNTISTILRILEQKGYVAHKAFGRSHQYYPLMAKEDYRKGVFKSLFQNYFGASFESLVSYFMKEEDMSLQDMEAIMKKIKEKEGGHDV